MTQLLSLLTKLLTQLLALLTAGFDDTNSAIAWGRLSLNAYVNDLRLMLKLGP